METISLPRVKAKGSRYALGRQHGGAFGPQVRALRDACLAHIERFGGITLDRALQRAESYLHYVREHIPPLAEEVRGIADGAGIRINEAALLQVRYEVVNLPTEADGCTILGVERERSAVASSLLAQNIDIPASNVPLLVLLHLCPDDGPEVLTCTVAGILAQTGINSEGLGLCGSFVVSANWGFGIPSRNFIRRHILEQPSISHAIGVMRRFSRRAFGHNVMLTDRSGRVVDIESTPDDFRVITPTRGLLAHTNHYRHPDFVPLDALASSSLRDFAESSHQRIARVESLLSALNERVQIAELQAILRDHEHYPKSVCRHLDGDPTETQSACSVALAPTLRYMSVAVGTPCEHASVGYCF